MFRVCFDREGFQAIPDTIHHKDRQMMVVVEGRWPHCWNCKHSATLQKFALTKEAETTQPPKAPEVDATKESSEAENPPSKEDGDSEEKKVTLLKKPRTH